MNGTFTNISDNLHQWQRRDSARFTQPYDTSAIRMAYYFNSSHNFTYSRISGFIQDNIRFDSANRLTATAGLRFNYSFLNNELLISPRLQLAYKPRGEKDIVVKFSTVITVSLPSTAKCATLKAM